jgi:cytoskeletal protein CcmA (bactofilin family)
VGAGDHIVALSSVEKKGWRAHHGVRPEPRQSPPSDTQSMEGTMALKGLVMRSMEGARGSVTSRAASTDARSEQVGDAPRVTMAQAPAPRSVAPSTSIDSTTELEGRLRCSETLRIDGRIVGEIECDKVVIIGQGGRVHAGIEADEVHVSGIVEGDITARRKVTLERTAVVVGDLTTPGIVIEEGAKLKGRILIGSDAEAEDIVAESKSEKSGAQAAASAEKGGERGDETSAATETKAPPKKSTASSASSKMRTDTSKKEPIAAASA